MMSDLRVRDRSEGLVFGFRLLFQPLPLGHAPLHKQMDKNARNRASRSKESSKEGIQRATKNR